MYTSIQLFMKLSKDFGINCCGSFDSRRLLGSNNKEIIKMQENLK